MKRLLAAGLLILAAGCDRMAPGARTPVYAAWEAGRTLVYRNPSRPGDERLQVRVKRADPGQDGMLVIQTFTTLRSHDDVAFRVADGGFWLKADAQTELLVLPKGFPDRTSRWMDRGGLNRVIGRAKVDLPGVQLPESSTEGIWVETTPPGHPEVRARRLLVPDLGEVQSMVWRNGHWEVDNILVSQGFTDPPDGSER
jgi:hypothetical protein